MSHEETCESDVFDDTELNVLLADVLSKMDRNEPVDVELLVASNPEYAEEIGSFFSLSHEVGAMLGAFPPPEPKRSTVEMANRSTASLDGATIPMLRDLPYDDTDPAKIGKYEIRRRLGGGEFGRVYLGFDPLAQREVAIKVPVRKERISNEQQRAFLHEAQSAASLRHEHIATLFDVLLDDSTGKVSLVYEYVAGPSLYQVLKGRDFSMQHVVGWIADIADALNYAHRRSIVHRDIKPSNIMLAEADGELQPRIVDFGLALMRNQSWRDSEGHVVGAFAYMSPEQASGDSHWATAQSDIFSLGIVLYEALCGQSPWMGSSGSAVLRDICKRHPSPPRVLNAAVPNELERICLKAMSKSPEDRYTTAGDMARELRAAMAPKSARPRWIPAAVAASLMCILISGVGAWSLSGSGDKAVPPIPAPPITPKITAKEVTLEIRIQPDRERNAYSVLDAETVDLEAGDGVQVYVETESPSYLYCLWYRPDGTVQALDAVELRKPRAAIQVPGVGPQAEWPRFGDGTIGDNLVVAFSKETPLTNAELATLQQVNWRTDANQLGELAMIEFGYPRSASNHRMTRGSQPNASSPDVNDNTYLGQFGTLIRDKWNCNYQAFVFRVNEVGYRDKGI